MEKLLKQAYIIAPRFDNDGRDVAEVHGNLQRSLIDAFGGYTCIHGATGAGPGPETWPGTGVKKQVRETVTEAVYVYLVAVDCSDPFQTRLSAEALEHVARQFKTGARQDSVYLVYPSGRVVFI